MAKIQVINQSLQVQNILIMESDTSTNKNVQLLPKDFIIIDQNQLTQQVRRLRDLNIVSIVPYTEIIEVV